jgi:hypothetical protein
MEHEIRRCVTADGTRIAYCVEGDEERLKQYEMGAGATS